ncbi:unnamed protein product, partial [Laminaria digitata]
MVGVCTPSLFVRDIIYLCVVFFCPHCHTVTGFMSHLSQQVTPTGVFFNWNVPACCCRCSPVVSRIGGPAYSVFLRQTFSQTYSLVDTPFTCSSPPLQYSSSVDSP